VYKIIYRKYNFITGFYNRIIKWIYMLHNTKMVKIIYIFLNTLAGKMIGSIESH